MIARRVTLALQRSAMAVTLLCLARTAPAADAAKTYTYAQDRDFLTAHTKVIELTSESGGRVALCPEYQGRVMTSTCDGVGGPSMGWINRAFIERGAKNTRFNNYGGEDRIWLGPEGGQFSLWFTGDQQQNVDNWYTPAALNDGAFNVVSGDNDPFYRLSRRMSLKNAAGEAFQFDVIRDIQILSPQRFGKIFGSEAQQTLEAGGLKMVGFQSVNTIVNRGAPMKRDKGLVAIWILGQFPPGPETDVVVPFRPGTEETLGPAINSDYFGPIPSERLKVFEQAALFRVDGKLRSKIGTSQRRARPVAGSLDLAAGVLTLVSFSMPDDPTAFSYVNNSWELPQKQPFAGDVFNSYNDGPPAPGKPSLGGFYELESVSPAAELPTGKAMGHTHSTFHVTGDPAALLTLAQKALGVELPSPSPPPTAERKPKTEER